MTFKREATIDDLRHVEGKAEIIEGEIANMPPTGIGPGYAGGEIFASLREYARRTRRGIAVPDNNAFRVDLPNRESFSPDAAFYTGPVGDRMKFYPRAPVFAAGVRSEGGYGAAVEVEMAQKRADYFAAGTLVVWDVDLLAEDVVRVYRSTHPATPAVYRRGQMAEAEPAVPQWTMPVDDLFLP